MKEEQVIDDTTVIVAYVNMNQAPTMAIGSDQQQVASVVDPALAASSGGGGGGAAAATGATGAPAAAPMAVTN